MPAATKRALTFDASGFLRIYSALALGAGAILIGWGPAWVGTSTLTRITAAMLVAFGCWAATLSQIEEPVLRSRGLNWFGAGLVVVLFVIYSQRVEVWGRNRPTVTEQVLPSVILAFLVLMGSVTRRHDRASGPRALLRAPGGAAERLRSRYEQQMRDAGAQEERNRLARDLHDSIKQQIFVIQTAAATAQTRFDSDRAGAATALELVRNSARDAMTEMEAMMDQLRSVPLENASLVEALKKQCEALGFRTGAHVEFRPIDLPPNGTLAPGAHQAILRVAQEALANIGRHARARNVTVTLDSLSDRIQLRIQDDGVGFDPFQGPQGMGIRNMRERADEFGGQFDLTSNPGAGTTIVFSLPHDEVPVGYRRRTILYGAALVLVLAIGWRFWTVNWAFPAVIVSVELVRGARDWLRARSYAEAKS